MHTTILNGMHAGDTTLATVQATLTECLQARGGDVTPFVLHELDVRPCGGCFGCWVQTPGRCLMHETDTIAQTMIRSELMVYLTPVTFGGYSSELKKVVDHLISNILPFFTKVKGETHHQPRYQQYPNLLVIGVLPEHDTEAEQIFSTLVERNAINMYAPHWAAKVLTPAQTDGALRETFETLLTKMEVRA